MKKVWWWCIAVVIFLMGGVEGLAIDPQYIFVRKDPMGCSPSDCSLLWNMTSPSKELLPAINDVYNKIGTHGSEDRKIGIGVIFNYNEYDYNMVKASLPVLLENVRVHNVPVYIALDGFQWWDTRPDLWNWWDANSPGYNIANKDNVEWTCWDNSCAIKKAWRNWGMEMEVKPGPNLASRTFIDANKLRVRELGKIIVDWYRGLPENQKWLLGGIGLGVETDVGGNYYYYPNGVKTDLPMVNLGYAAVKTAGIRSSGGPPTTEEINQVVRNYVDELNKVMYDLGFPRNKLFNHVAAEELSPNPLPTGINFPSTESGLTAYANPGWSFYGPVTVNTDKYAGLQSTLNKNANGEWASPEWLTWESGYDGWVRALRNSLNFRNNRFINIANWESIREKPEILEAIKTVANESPSCWTRSAQLGSVTTTNNSVKLNWTNGNGEATYLAVSNSNEIAVGGGLKNVNVVNEVVTGRTSYEKNGLVPGKYYWQLTSDGCGNQRKHSEVGWFELSVKIGDANNDGVVNMIDFSIWKDEYIMGDVQTLVAKKADFNQDSKVDMIDFSIWKSEYLKTL